MTMGASGMAADRDGLTACARNKEVKEAPLQLWYDDGRGDLGRATARNMEVIVTSTLA